MERRVFDLKLIMRVLKGSVFISTLSVLCALALSQTSCKKKQEASAPATSNEPVASAPAPAPESSTTAPAIPEPAASTDANQALNSAQVALKNREYDKAAATLLYAQQQSLNQQQAEAARAQMAQLQKDLIGALGTGDPKAKAAADMIRAAHSHR